MCIGVGADGYEKKKFELDKVNVLVELERWSIDQRCVGHKLTYPP